MAKKQAIKKSVRSILTSILGMTVGSLLAAISIRFFFFPNELIDGGIIGISMILSKKTNDDFMSYYLILLNAPFIYLAYKHIRKSFMLYMGLATILFALFLALFQEVEGFTGVTFDILEVIVIGGALLGIGVGLIIRNGGCTDGTEILAIIINRKKGFTVGQVVLSINVIIFAAYGLIFNEWHPAIYSLLTYIVAFKMMDLVITGLDEMKSVRILSSKPKEVGDLIMTELGLGLTILKGKGGFSGVDRDILFVIVERLDLAELKDIVLETDPEAFLAIENLHEVVSGRQSHFVTKTQRRGRRKKKA